MTPISERQPARFNKYIKKKFLNVYIYMQKARHFAKSKTICVTFLLTKSLTLYVTRFFMKFLKLAFIYIQKALHFALRDVLYKNDFIVIIMIPWVCLCIPNLPVKTKIELKTPGVCP